MKKPVAFVVDDQPFICKTIEAILSGKYEVHTFISGREAIEYMTENVADIILLDYYMPGMSGLEVLLAIRSCKLNSKVPVIFITTETNEQIKSEMLERGANDYIFKPVNSDDLIQRMAQHLSPGIA